MNQIFAPIILGSIFLFIGAVSFWGRFRLSRMGAKASTALNANISYDRAYQRRLRYGYISGLIFLVAGAGFLVFGVIGLIVDAG